MKNRERHLFLSHALISSPASHCRFHPVHYGQQALSPSFTPYHFYRRLVLTCHSLPESVRVRERHRERSSEREREQGEVREKRELWQTEPTRSDSTERLFPRGGRLANAHSPSAPRLLHQSHLGRTRASLSAPSPRAQLATHTSHADVERKSNPTTDHFH